MLAGCVLLHFLTECFSPSISSSLLPLPRFPSNVSDIPPSIPYNGQPGLCRRICNRSPPPLPLLPLPLPHSLPTAVCATTLLYDYALTLGEEVRPRTDVPWPSYLTISICFRRSRECGRQSLSLRLHPTNSHSPQSPPLYTKIPIPSQQICRDTYVSVRKRAFPSAIDTANIVTASMGSASLPSMYPPLSSSPPTFQLHRGLTFRKMYVRSLHNLHSPHAEIYR